MKFCLTTSALALCVALAPPALAQDDPDTITIIGSATPATPEQLGQSITVVSAETIANQGYVYAPDALRQVPSLAVSQAGAPGSLTQARIRGAEANHTLVFWDGFDISSPDIGEADLSTLLTGGLSRIEVLRGPQSGLYGSNALAGVVNLVSRGQGAGHSANLSIEAGSFNTLRIDGGAGIGDGDNYLSGDVSSLTSDGYDVSPDQTANDVPAVGVGGHAGDKEGNEVLALHLRGGLALNDIVDLTGVARYLKATSELDGQAFGFPIAGRAYDDASETEHEQTLVGATAIIDPFNGFWETTLSASHLDESRISRTTNFPFLFVPPVPSPADLLLIPLDQSGSDSTRTKFGALSTLRFGGDGILHYLTGFAEHEKETFEDPFTGRDETRTLNAYGLQYRAEIADQLNLYATGRHDDNDGGFQDVDTWSLAASWNIPGTDTRLHASWGTGVTNPTFIEQFGFDPSSFTGNAALVPEESIGWDFGIEHRFFDEALVIDLTYFESNLDHEIFTAFLPGFIATPLNSGSESDRSGWELYVTATPTDDISLAGSWSTLDATDPGGAEIRRPEQQGSFDGSWRVFGGPVQLNLGVTYNGQMTDTDFATFLPTRIAPYTLVRLGASWQVDERIELYARAENLLDEDYQEVIGYNAAPQAVYIGVRFREGDAK